MPLRYSYLVEIKQKEVEIKALQIAYLQSNDPSLLERIQIKEKELNWFKEKLKENPNKYSKPEIL